MTYDPEMEGVKAEQRQHGKDRKQKATTGGSSQQQQAEGSR